MLNLKNINPENLREYALFLIISVQNKNNFEEILVEFERSIILKDIRNYNFIYELVEGTYKKKIIIDSFLEFLIKKDFKKLPPIILNILRLGIYQLEFMNSVPPSAAINESVNLAKKYGHPGTTKLTNAVLRNFLRKREEIYNFIKSLPENKKHSIEFSLPLWLVNYWSENKNLDELKSLCQSMDFPAPIYLRINCLKILPIEFKNELQKLNINYAETVIEEIIELKDRFPLNQLYGYDSGLWYIQDLGSALVCKVLNPETNSFIIDFCAFPGGKTSYLSGLMNNSGKILAIDINKNREKRFTDNILRLGIKNVDTIIQSATADIELEFLADKILVDPPCSGLGIIRRKPEIKYKANINDIKRLSDLQYEILLNASKYLKIGGELVYSTCTLSYFENENIIEKFLFENKNFSFQGFNLFKEEKVFMNLYPYKHFTDGFFIAKLKKVT
jgi:16S rRNA (cytosine967-C5)-methyltransferase